MITRRAVHSSRRPFTLTLCLVAATACGCTPTAQAPTSGPDHLVIMVFDQMRPDYIDRFGLEHFRRLRATARHYPEAYVGHMGSQTIVSHVVIPTGLAPKDLPWQDDLFIDAEGLFGKPGAVYETGLMTRTQFFPLLARIPRQQFLTARLTDAFGGSVFVVGEKDYAATVFGAPHASAIVTLTKVHGRCTPDGVNVPEYIADNPRFSLECAEAYGTGYPTIYSLDGSRYVPGNDPSRPGGDVWTADAAIAIMEREAWSGLFLTFGGIDKVAHMLGEHDDRGVVSVPSQYRLADALRTADAQLGRILDAIEKRGLADRTMIVVTADHGGQRHEAYLGNGRFQSCCAFENSSSKVDPPYWIEHLNRIGKLHTAYADSSISLWLAEHSEANEQAVTRGLKDVSGITEIYAKRRTGGQYRYERVHSNLDRQGPAFQAWARRHSSELVNTMAGAAGPDLVGLLADGFGFGRIGGHGGAQEQVQRIPMIIRVPREPPSVRMQPLRLMDLAPEITQILGLPPAPVTTALR